MERTHERTPGSREHAPSVVNLSRAHKVDLGRGRTLHARWGECRVCGATREYLWEHAGWYCRDCGWKVGSYIDGDGELHDPHYTTRVHVRA